jgi:hypothetical protein
MTGSRLQAGPHASMRVRAALAAGVVFGITAGLTVASWTDAEFLAPATFTASRFDVQTSLQGAAFTSASTVSTTVTGLYPSATLTSGNAYVSLKAQTATPSVAGTVQLSAAANAGAGLTPVLRYRIVSIAAASTCSAASFTGTPTYIVGGAAAYQSVSSALAATTASAVGANSGTTVQYCLEFSIPPGSAQATYAGTSATLTLIVAGSSS